VTLKVPVASVLFLGRASHIEATTVKPDLVGI
jgi:hypothetical protein